MVRYTGPRVRIIRRLGLLPGLTRKNAKNRTKTPGQHGKLVFAKTKRSSLSDDYKERLLEKQKLRFNYGVTEKQLVGYFKEAKNTLKVYDTNKKSNESLELRNININDGNKLENNQNLNVLYNYSKVSMLLNNQKSNNISNTSNFQFSQKK